MKKNQTSNLTKAPNGSETCALWNISSIKNVCVINIQPSTSCNVAVELGMGFMIRRPCGTCETHAAYSASNPILQYPTPLNTASGGSSLNEQFSDAFTAHIRAVPKKSQIHNTNKTIDPLRVLHLIGQIGFLVCTGQQLKSKNTYIYIYCINTEMDDELSKGLITYGNVWKLDAM